MRFVTLANGLTLHYALDGTAEAPTIIFIHALGTTLRIWDEVVPHFADSYTVLRYDLRGHGLSDCPPGPYTIQDEVDDLAQWIDALQIRSPILAGISVGGLIVMGYASQHPEHVRALVLSDTGTKIGTPPYWNDRIDSIRQHGMESMAEKIVTRWFAPDFAGRSTATYRGFQHLLTRMPVDGYTATCEAIRDADMHDAVGLIRAPTLVLCGDQDVSTPPDLGRALADSIDGARFIQIDEAGHLPCVEQSDHFAAWINAFLEEIGDAG